MCDADSQNNVTEFGTSLISFFIYIIFWYGYSGCVVCLSISYNNLFRINVSEDGKKALLTLSGGDMRRILNILQSTSMAFDEVSVINCCHVSLKEDMHFKMCIVLVSKSVITIYC